MNLFSLGEIVRYTRSSHVGRRDVNGKRPATITSMVKFVAYKVPDRAVIEIETPIGITHKQVPLTSITKLVKS